MDAKLRPYSAHHHADTITCRKCGQPGKIVWDSVSRARNSQMGRSSVEGPFFERISRDPPYPIELVCRECGGVAITAYPSTALHDRREYN